MTDSAHWNADDMVFLTPASIFSVSVCVPADWPRALVEASANVKKPAGTSQGWKVSADECFHGGEPNPCQCERNPERMHYLLDC